MDLVLLAQNEMVMDKEIHHIRLKSAILIGVFLMYLCLYIHSYYQGNETPKQAEDSTLSEISPKPDADIEVQSAPFCKPAKLPEALGPAVILPESNPAAGIETMTTNIAEVTTDFTEVTADIAEVTADIAEVTAEVCHTGIQTAGTSGLSSLPEVEDNLETHVPDPLPYQVTLNVNGGMQSVREMTFEQMPDPKMLPVMRRLGKIFTGWYTDASCLALYNGEENLGQDFELYAGWEEFPGFLSDDNGFIIGYTDVKIASDGLLVPPFHEDCAGIAAGAFKGLEDMAFEAYLPANIVYIEEGAFDNLINMFYIEVAPDNPVFYSSEGIVYYREGDGTAVYPQGRL